jgi:hypothetical protein
MYLPAKTTRTTYQEIVSRKTRESCEWFSKNLDGTEEYSIVSTHNGIGMRVFIRSIRAKELFSKLHQDVFPQGFVQPQPWLEDNGAWSVWYGYSEPWPPMNYVSIPTTSPYLPRR